MRTGTVWRGVQRHSDKENPGDGNVQHDVRAVEHIQTSYTAKYAKCRSASNAETIENGSKDQPSPEEEYLYPNAKGNCIGWLRPNCKQEDSVVC